MGIKLVTFDLWGTLIKINPEFRKKRIVLLRDIFSFTHSDEEIEKTISKFKNMHVQLSQITGFDTSSKTISIWKAVIQNLNPSLNLRTHLRHKEKFTEFMDRMDILFTQLKPLYFDENTKEVFHRIDEEYKVAIISNSAGLAGNIVRDGLIALDHSFIDIKCFFSSETGTYKPNPDMFIKAMVYANVTPEETLHVGDDFVCDIRGPQVLGIHTLQINKINENITNVIPWIDKINKHAELS